MTHYTNTDNPVDFPTIKQYVFVVLCDNSADSVTECLGVYKTQESAETEKYAIIRDRFDISKEEVPDEKLDDEISNMDAYYTIVRRELL